MNKMIKIVIADDHPLLLKGLKFTLRAENDFEIVGEADDGKEALQLIIDKNPDIAILDYDMPKLTGLEVAEEMKVQNVNTSKLIFLTVHKDKDVFKKALKLGAKGYLLKDSVEDEIVTAIRKVNNGEHYISPTLSGFLINDADENESSETNNSLLCQLTAMEKKVLIHIANNKTSHEIAEELFISEKTVSRHRSNICVKLDISGHNSLVRFALNHKDNILS